jgi:hypothetical protein
MSEQQHDQADPYGTFGHAIMHPDAHIRDKAARFVDGKLPQLPPWPEPEHTDQAGEDHAPDS